MHIDSHIQATPQKSQTFGLDSDNESYKQTNLPAPETSSKIYDKIRKLANNFKIC